MDRVDRSVTASNWQQRLREQAHNRYRRQALATLNAGEGVCLHCGRTGLNAMTGRVGMSLIPVCNPACPAVVPQQRRR